MKRKTLNIIWIAIIAACLAGFFFLGKASHDSQSEKTCEDLSVSFSDNLEFVSASDVKGYIESLYGPYIGQRLDSLDLNRIETILDNQSAVLKSEVYVGGDRILHVNISQREPVIRFQNGNNGFYIDDRGFIFPLQRNYTSQVPVIDGYIPVSVWEGYKGEAQSTKESQWLDGVLDMVAFIKNSKIWNENIVQIHVNDNSDIVLVPREGNEKFIFGSPDCIERKFSRIEKYYQYIQPLDKRYTSVDVRYKGQIICK